MIYYFIMKNQPKSLPIIIAYFFISFLLPFPIAAGLMLCSENGVIPTLSEQEIAMYINMLVYIVMPLFSVLYYRKKIASDTKNFGRLIVLILPLIMMVYGASILGGILIQQLDHSNTTQNQTYLEALKNLNVYFTTYMAVFAAPVCEESVFRCAMIGQKKGLASFFMVLVSSALFSLAHGLDFSIGAFFAYFFIALVLGFIYVYHRNLVLNILVHSGYNTLALILSTFLTGQ